jgi:uncharacterized protein YqgC (DUF456 family)
MLGVKPAIQSHFWRFAMTNQATDTSEKKSGARLVDSAIAGASAGAAIGVLAGLPGAIVGSLVGIAVGLYLQKLKGKVPEVAQSASSETGNGGKK